MISTKEASIYHRNVELYDIAFDWNIDSEVSWLLTHLGSQCRSILEPGCGSGRMLEAFAKKHIDIVGFDTSQEGVFLAQRRIAAMPNASAVLGDMTQFDLERIFDGAICPINTLAILSPEELKGHFKCMSRHLHTGARYMVQVALRDKTKSSTELDENSIEWEAHRGDIHLPVKVWVEHEDYDTMRELHAFKIMVESGKRAGEVILEKHWMMLWTADSFQKVIDASLFRQVAQYDGDNMNYPSVSIGSSGNLMWHQLILQPA